MKGGRQGKKGGGGQNVYIISKLKSDVKACIHYGGKRRDKIWEEMERYIKKRDSKQYQEYYLITLQE